MWIIAVLLIAIIGLTIYLAISRRNNAKLDSYYDPREIPTSEETMRGTAGGMSYGAGHHNSY
jgi:hypothetical protein